MQPVICIFTRFLLYYNLFVELQNLTLFPQLCTYWYPLDFEWLLIFSLQNNDRCRSSFDETNNQPVGKMFRFRPIFGSPRRDSVAEAMRTWVTTRRCPVNKDSRHHNWSCFTYPPSNCKSRLFPWSYQWYTTQVFVKETSPRIFMNISQNIYRES